MIKEWLNYQEQEDKYIFKTIHITEGKPPEKNLIAHLQEQQKIGTRKQGQTPNKKNSYLFNGDPG